ncbi:MAG: type II toxin-antitoxin system VapC family toxin [Acidobacteria bacterium]|nr:type II toxin-antitoxin system VapC family toxin [Acidobacteriota bacterium]
MNLVVDASVAAKWLVAEEDSDKARHLLTEWRQGKASLTAPDLILPEVASVLWKRAQRRALPSRVARDLYLRFERLSLPLAASEGLVGEALSMAVQHGNSVYDGVYVALSRTLNWDYLTADAKLHRLLSPFFPKIVLLGDWRT